MIPDLNLYEKVWKDPLRNGARRAWKNEAITAIRSDLQDPDYLVKRFGNGVEIEA